MGQQVQQVPQNIHQQLPPYIPELAVQASPFVPNNVPGNVVRQPQQPPQQQQQQQFYPRFNTQQQQQQPYKMPSNNNSNNNAFWGSYNNIPPLPNNRFPKNQGSQNF